MIGRRFGHTERDLIKANQVAHNLAGDGTNATHVVEVYDEGEFPSREGPVGVIYVVEATQYDAFVDEHDGECEILDTEGYDPAESPTEPPPTDEDREAQAAYDDYWRL